MELRKNETRARRLWQKSAAGDGWHRSRRCGRCGAQRLPRSDRRICQRGISHGCRGDTGEEVLRAIIASRKPINMNDNYLNSEAITSLVVLIEEGIRSTDRGVRRFIEPGAGTFIKASSKTHSIIFGRRGS